MRVFSSRTSTSRASDYRRALEQLIAIVERDRKWGDDIGRKTMLKVFELIGNQGELVSEFRRRLARTMNWLKHPLFGERGPWVRRASARRAGGCGRIR